MRSWSKRKLLTFMHAHLVQIEIHEMTYHFVITVVQASIGCITIVGDCPSLALNWVGQGGMHEKVPVCR